jgi:ribose-phosphate pyrophosphokinase
MPDWPSSINDASAPNEAKAMAVDRGRPRDKTAIILDDMADTAGTLTEAAAGVIRTRVPVKFTPAAPIRCLSGPAVDRIWTIRPLKALWSRIRFR